MKISIVTINYNNLEGLKRTAQSVISQTWREFEWILIDGKSSDGSKEFIQNLATDSLNNISYWCSEPDNGIYNAMNKGITKAKGTYLLFLNSGDELYDSFVIESVKDYLYDADIIVGDCWAISVTGIGRFNPQPETLSIDILYNGSLCHPASFIKSDILKPKGYREDLRIVSDWEFFLKSLIFEDKSYRHVPFKICKFYEDGISQDKMKSNIERKSVISEYFPALLQDSIFGGTPLYKSLRLEPQNSFLYRTLWFIFKIMMKLRTILGNNK